MKFILRLIAGLFLFIVGWSSFINAFEIFAPWPEDADETIHQQQENVEEDQDFWIDLISIVNEYLWFFVWIIAMGVVLYGWYLLVTSSGNEEEYKKATKLLIYWLVWIIVALSAYLLVSFIVNLDIN